MTRGCIIALAAVLLGATAPVTTFAADPEEVRTEAPAAEMPPEEAANVVPELFPPTPPTPIVLPPRPHPPVARGERATRIIIDKSWRRMMVESNRKVRRFYNIGLGDDPIGHKEQRGDSRTPEGRYFINFKHDKSKFHLALRVSYPNERDRARARKLKVHPGSDIMIHGTPTGLEWWKSLLVQGDWTDGCVAVTNGEIEEIWKLVSVGTPVIIRP